MLSFKVFIYILVVVWIIQSIQNMDYMKFINDKGSFHTGQINSIL